MTGDIVAKQQNAIRLKRIGGLDDVTNTVDTHERLAGVQVGYNSELQRQTGGPARWRDVVARDTSAPRLGERIPAKAGAGHRRYAKCCEKTSTCEQID
jgi:hypothetical protein